MEDPAVETYQLLLALAGLPGREWATVKELAERLQLTHHSVVELVNRALSALHRDEPRRMGSALTPPPWPGKRSQS